MKPLRFLVGALVCGILAGGLAAPAAAAGSPALKRAALLRVRIYTERGNWSAAEAELQQILAEWPRDPAVQSQLASVYRQQGKNQEAEAILRPLVAQYPRDPDLARDLAWLCSDAARDSEVVELLAPFVATGDTESPELVLLYAGSCDRIGRIEESERLYQALADRRFTDVPTLLMIGDFYLAHDRTDRAVDCFQTVLKTQPKNYRALKGLGVALAQTDPLAARAALEKALPLDKLDYEVPYLLAEALLATAPVTAQGYYKTALERIDHDSSPAYAALVARARICFRLGRIAEADRLYVSLLTQHGQDQDLRNDYAEMLIEEGRFDDALRLLNASR